MDRKTQIVLEEMKSIVNNNFAGLNWSHPAKCYLKWIVSYYQEGKLLKTYKYLPEDSVSDLGTDVYENRAMCFAFDWVEDQEIDEFILFCESHSFEIEKDEVILVDYEEENNNEINKGQIALYLEDEKRLCIVKTQGQSPYLNTLTEILVQVFRKEIEKGLQYKRVCPYKIVTQNNYYGSQNYVLKYLEHKQIGKEYIQHFQIERKKTLFHVSCEGKVNFNTQIFLPDLSILMNHWGYVENGKIISKPISSIKKLRFSHSVYRNQTKLEEEGYTIPTPFSC